MDMYSPCGSSPMDQGSSYLPMSPGDLSNTYYVVIYLFIFLN